MNDLIARLLRPGYDLEKEQAIRAAIAEIQTLRTERDALRAEVDNIKEVEFPRKAQAVADGWRAKCERLEAELAALKTALREIALSNDSKWQADRARDVLGEQK